MKRWLSCLLVVGGLGLVLTACDSGPKSAKGFQLPDGDVEKGQAAFVALKCHTCHRVEGVSLPEAASPASKTIVLGGEVSRVRTYGELVTSVIYPSHGLAPGFVKEQIPAGQLSPMPEFNEVMTVGQMIDLVAFLQSHYKELELDYPITP